MSPGECCDRRVRDMTVAAEVRERLEDATEPAFRMQKGPQANKCWQPLEFGKKGKAWILP